MAEQGAGTFDTLRPWRGEQSRAFEELSYQLLKGHVPPGTRAIRTGNPDGGVEWYATLPDGTEWGWQAKHVHGIDALLTAMTASVERVARDRPPLRKLTFVISWNLATGRNRGERKSQREKYEDKIRAWKRDVTRADEIEFALVQESDLLAELSKPEHAGRRMFWWGQTVLGSDWLRQRYREQAEAAGDKYRPDLQVDVPIQQDLLALGFDADARADFLRRRYAVTSAISELRDPPETDEETVRSYAKAQAAVAAVKAALDDLYVAADADPIGWDPVLPAANSCRDAMYDAARSERDVADGWKSGDGGPRREYPYWAEGYAGRKLRRELSSLIDWLESSVGEALRRRTYFLTGQAGSGKTHLFLDATGRALDADRPAVFLAGARFGQPQLWASVTDQLGLGSIGSVELLQAMDAAGEAVSLSGSRFIIFVDALNETVPPEFWKTHLPALRAALASYPHIALAVSCRDTYEPLVLDGVEADRYVRRDHPGFADREVEATQRYFAHYHLEAPRIPLLTPEFTLPLFLRLYCESFKGVPEPPQPVGHEGRLTIFSRYLRAKIDAVARRFHPGATSHYELDAARRDITGVLDGLLDAMADAGRESLSFAVAEAVARAQLPDTPADARRALGLLQEEGVLTREMIYLGDGVSEDGMRVTFHAFSDFLLLKRRFGRSDDALSDDTLKAWLRDECTWGIREAALVYLPEVYGVELPDYLEETPAIDAIHQSDHEAWRKEHRTRYFYEKLVETLPYRQASAITDRTIELLNIAQAHMRRSDLYRSLITCAPQTNHRLNGQGLHRYLLQRKMSERDADFGIAVYHDLQNTYSPLSRLARWAAAGPYPYYEPDTIELATIPLCWLLSSPNRFMRDWVTKALVELLRGHLDVALRLVERFWTVDDPYVIQRIIAIAYGALLRSDPSDEHAKPLAERIADLAFTPPIRADELLLDAARGVVRWGVAYGHLTPDAAVKAKRPYGLPLPAHPPTKASLKTKYDWREGQPDEESYSGIWLSIFELGDFGRYVVDSTFHHFSKYRIGQSYPEHEVRSTPRFIKTRWEAFVASLGEDEKTKLAWFLSNPTPTGLSPLTRLRSDDAVSLTDEQERLLDRVFVYAKPVDHEYPTERARRWVMNRTVTRGWAPQLFGHEDRVIGYGRTRESRAERWGKKYQWMALHELLARVADNYQPRRSYFDGDVEVFDGLHQMIGDREIDPSLPPIDYRALTDDEVGEASGWQPPSIRITTWPPKPLDFAKYRGDTRAFVVDHASEPTQGDLLFLRDTNGDDWVALDAMYTQVDPSGSETWRGLRQQAWLDTFLVKAGKGRTALEALANRRGNDLYFVTSDQGHIDCCYVAEVGRIAPNCYHRHDAFRTVEVGDGSLFDAVATVEEYTWEGSILDASLKGSANLMLPSTYLQQGLGLAFDVCGPSWLDASGRPAFVNYEPTGGNNRALLVRADVLKQFLADRDLELLTLLSLERFEVTGTIPRGEPRGEWHLQGWLDNQLSFHSGKLRRQEANVEPPGNS